MNLCFQLQADGRVGREAQESLWRVGNDGLLVLARFDGSWIGIVEGGVPALEQLHRLTGDAGATVQALERAQEEPTRAHLGEAVLAMGAAVDRVDAMLDGSTA